MCGDVIFELTQSIDALSWAEILYPFVFLVTFFPIIRAVRPREDRIAAGVHALAKSNGDGSRLGRK